MKCFQVFLAPENAQEGFWCAGGLCSALGVCPAAPQPWDSWDSLATPQGQQDHSHHQRLCCLVALGMPSAVTASASGLAGLPCRKGLAPKSQRRVWRPGWVCPRMNQSGGITRVIIIWHGHTAEALLVGGSWTGFQQRPCPWIFTELMIHRQR